MLLVSPLSIVPLQKVGRIDGPRCALFSLSRKCRRGDSFTVEMCSDQVWLSVGWNDVAKLAKLELPFKTQLQLPIDQKTQMVESNFKRLRLIGFVISCYRYSFKFIFIRSYIHVHDGITCCPML